MNRNSNLRIVLECALLIALGTILAQIKLYRFPNGGSITAFSMAPFIVISLRHGTKWGLLAGLANACLQMLIGGIYPPPAGTLLSLLASILLDYVLAYVVLGLAYTFAKPFNEHQKNIGVIYATACVCLLRFLCAFLSGWLIWGEVGMTQAEAIIYSISYNASYLIPETVLCCFAVWAINKYIPNVFKK